MLIRRFFAATMRDWGSLVTGAASIPLTIAAFWAQTPAQRTLWAAFAVICFVVASYRVWAAEYRRATNAEERLANARPWVTIDQYYGVYHEDEDTGDDFLVEKVSLVNRGGMPAVSIELPSIESGGRTARVLGTIPTLAPNERAEVRILNLDYLLDGVKKKTGRQPKGRGSDVRIPMVVKYRNLNHETWRTDHVVTANVRGVKIEIAHPDNERRCTISAEEVVQQG